MGTCQMVLQELARIEDSLDPLEKAAAENMLCTSELQAARIDYAELLELLRVKLQGIQAEIAYGADKSGLCINSEMSYVFPFEDTYDGMSLSFGDAAVPAASTTFRYFEIQVYRAPLDLIEGNLQKAIT
ncbi:hypothetical protein NDU88_004592 [Pleurodeles waltl]|uniref:Uncharacterized protein n=1 Tax=Pleurodeles waltl TaxID=8319 RepID=A0AAV7T7V3_PLEWA|nr:hypothetical protein NDU88_004592 [Pleurodeles waltl]